MTDVDSYKGKKKHGFFHKIKELKHKHEEPKMEISGPTDFKHESHIGWDEKNGFEIKNIPPEWRQLFQQAGIKKKDLKNPETVQFIYSVIGENINNQKMGLNTTTTTTTTAGSAGGVLPPSQRARAPPPPPPGASKVSANRGPPPKPGAEIRQLPQKQYQAQTSKPLPPQPSQNKQMAQQQPPGQYQQRRPSNPQLQQQQQQQQIPAATSVRGNLPTTLGGKPIPVTMIRPGGDSFVSPTSSRKQPQPPQQTQQQLNNEPLIQQEVKTQYVLDEPLQPTTKSIPQISPTQQNQQYNNQNITTTVNADGSQTYTYKPQSDSGQNQYTYQAPNQQQTGFNNYYSVKSPQPAQEIQQQQSTKPIPQQPPKPIRKLPTPGQQRKNQSPPPIPTSKRPAVQPPQNITSPQTRIAVQPPIIQRTQIQEVTITNKYDEPINDDMMPPPPPPMPDSIAHIVPEHIDPKSPLPPPPKNANPSIPPISLTSQQAQPSISAPPAPAPPPPPVSSLKTPTTSSPANNIPPQTSDRANLMDSIRNFGGANHLKKVDPSEPLPDLKELQLGEEGNRSLVDTLAAAMAQRRGNLGEDDEDDDDDSDWDC